jgi:hypothetical protein
MEEGEKVGRMGKGKNEKEKGKKKGKDKKERPYYLGGFDINFINFINGRFSK